MINQDYLIMPTEQKDDNDLFIPKITSLILQGIHIDPSGHVDHSKSFKVSDIEHGDSDADESLLPEIAYSKERTGTSKRLIHLVEQGRSLQVTYNHNKMKTLRLFIGSLSHHYNNLLTGIWGNASLIGLSMEKDHPSQKYVNQIETIIQNGSKILHILFGYIVERRSLAKKIRLKQLIQEIDAYNQISGNQIAFRDVVKSLRVISKIQNKVQITSFIIPIMDRIIKLIGEKCVLIDQNNFELKPKAKSQLSNIEELLKRGYKLILNLKYYADLNQPKMKRVSLKSLIRHQSEMLNDKNRHVDITCDVSTPIPWIKADKHQINYAVNQLIDNAVESTLINGKVHIAVKTLNSETPKERCGVRMLSNYAVVSISDNGSGMDTSKLAQIFDPFYNGQGDRMRQGLGLAAAAGIIKLHGGYIQVRSNPGSGSIFKIYLPISDKR